MKLRLFSRNSAKTALSSLICLLLSSCSFPLTPTYTPETLSKSLEKILREEYSISSVSRLTGEALWVYIPTEEAIFIESEKPESYVKIFDPKSIEGNLQDGIFNFNYAITEIPETKETQNTKFNPAIAELMNKALRSIRRVIFSLKRDKGGPKFFVIALCDIKNGIEVITTTYIDDFKKASYEIISWTEYQHRGLEDIKLAPEAIGDKEGNHLVFHDIHFNEFLLGQIQQRLRQKFNRPEVKKGADIDKEVLKTIRNVLEIYGFDDFLLVSLHNITTNNKTTLSKAAALEEAKE